MKPFKRLLTQTRKLFSDIKDIPEPTKMYSKYWNYATHVWKPTVNSEEVSDAIIMPFPSEKLFIVSAMRLSTTETERGEGSKSA